MKTKAVIAVLGLAGAALALPATAQMTMNAAYIGGALGQSKFKGDCGIPNCDTKDTSFRLFGGYQFTPNIAAELGYTDGYTNRPTHRREEGTMAESQVTTGVTGVETGGLEPPTPALQRRCSAS